MFAFGAAALVVVVSCIGRLRARDRAVDRRAVRLGLVLIGVGLAAHLLVLGANGGHVPSTADALRTAGQRTLDDQGGPRPELVDRQLGILGNLVAWPAPLPLASVVGLPVVCALVGLAVLLRRPPRAPEVTRLELESGQFWWDAPPGSEGLEIQLPGAVLRAPSARVGVDLGPKRGVVVVIEGEVELEGPAGSVTVVEGHGIEVGPDGPIGEPVALSAREVADDPWIGPHLAEVGRRRPRPTTPGPGWPLPAVLAGLALAGMVAVTYVAQVASVPSESMAPTLEPGDRVLVAKAAGAPVGGDVVVFERPPGAESPTDFLVKRVVAIGGQEVEVRGGRVLVDGRPLAEPYLPDGVRTEAACGPQGVVEVPAGSLYVLGDNRADSYDSRCFGPVPQDLLVGTVVRTVVPFGEQP